jgi:hypothetical protein
MKKIINVWRGWVGFDSFAEENAFLEQKADVFKT